MGTQEVLLHKVEIFLYYHTPGMCMGVFVVALIWNSCCVTLFAHIVVSVCVCCVCVYVCVCVCVCVACVYVYMCVRTRV